MKHTGLSPLIVASILFLGMFRAYGESGTHDGIFFEIQGAGPALVLLHGGQMDRRMWDAQFDI